MLSIIITFHLLTTLGIIVTIMIPILQAEKLRDIEESDSSKVIQPVSDTAGIKTLICPTPESELLKPP